MQVAMIGGHGFGRAVAKDLLDHGHEITNVISPDPKMVDLCVDAGATEGWGRETEAEMLISVHNHAWITQEQIDRFRYGCIGYHPSLLPLHRGKDAIRWTIHMKESVAGGTVYLLEGDEADTGPIVFQDWCLVHPDWDASALWRAELFPMGVRLIRKTVEYVEANDFVPATPQDEDLATWEPAWDRPKLKEQA